MQIQSQFEQLYLSVNETAAFLRVGRDTVIRRFSGQPGVLDLGVGPVYANGKRRYRQLRIPIAVVRAYIRENSNK